MKKNTLWSVLAGTVALAVVASVCYLLVEQRNIRTIEVSGECLTTVPKDRTAITLRVTTSDKNAAVSMRRATEKITKITEYLKTLPVKMQTTEFNSHELTRWNQTERRSVVTGIETTIAMEVSADKVETIEQILSEFAGEKDVFLQDLHMYTCAETMKAALEKCLPAALENARRRAEVLAAGDNRKAGKLLSVSCGAGRAQSNQPRLSNFYRNNMESMAVVKEAAGIDGAIVSKDTEVSVQVSAVFELK